MACPFFMPTEKFEVWLPHRARLPLGDAWSGHCTAPDCQGARPSDHDLQEFCNFGYAKYCPRLPQTRLWDAVRFAVSRERDGKIVICFVCEVDHRPGEHGALEYELARGVWTTPHHDACVQKMAQCYLESYMERKAQPVPPGRPSR